MSSLFAGHEPREIGATGRYALVSVERGIERAGASGEPDSTLAYRADDPLLAVGDRVRVPLGRGNTPAEGIVVGLGGREVLGELDPARVKPMLARLGPSVRPDLLDLARWISDYYICPLGMVLGAMVPAAAKRGPRVVRVTLLSPTPPADAERLLADPKIATKPVLKAWGVIASLNAGDFPCTAKALVEAGVPRAGVKRLVAAGLLAERMEERPRASGPSGLTATDSPPSGPAAAPSVELTPEQRGVVEGVVATLGTFAAHLIRGVTGSGKTEVYLRVIEACLRAGKRAIVLVPEIALTPQTAGRFVHRFGGSVEDGGWGVGAVAVLHSGLTPAQRAAQWAACADASSPVRVVVGARSAIFAPVEDLGVIVVDEEHDGSYKQDQLPRYHARDVAVKRAHLARCPVLLGSATPSLESFANADAPPGGAAKYALWTLPRRVGGASLPRVEIVDLAEERRARARSDGWRDGHFHLIGPTLEAALDRTLAQGGQAILLLNKRGYANHICCPDQRCGWVMHCADCDATMVFHLALGRAPDHAGDAGAAPHPRRPGYVRCHHCLAEQRLPALCPLCRKTVNTFGQGTQRVEEEIERKFGQTRGLRTGSTLVRVDADTMRSAQDYFDALDRFARGEARVLLGTQMIAKGLDFPNVRLVGVVNADTALALPDFRASERTFQLVSQVAGRAGRGTEPGLVIVQSLSPRAPSIVLAARHDYEAFAREEISFRQRAGLPPAARMARVVCRDEDYAKALTHAGEVWRALQSALDALGPAAGHTRLRPPTACPIARIARHHRIAVEVYASTRGVIQRVLQDARSRGLLRSDARTAVDVDPIALL